MADKKRDVRMRRFVAETKKDPEAWAAATSGARQVNDAILALCGIVGQSMTADFLRQWAEILSAHDHRAKARKTDYIPSIIGRTSNNAEGDAALKAKLRNPPMGANGRPQKFAAMARIRAFGEDRPPHPDRNADHVAYRSARTHLTRLRAEVRAEDNQATADYLARLDAGDVPNLLALLAGLPPSKSET
ncbi:hypothetical protein AAFN86_25775 [Roseomonas sp. CAU 1739]|uniref:hypothetical protein n=1 Tax=Roseomonas sp. CAU 1739 TaxID=3140364 RepID=UPI00325A59D7